MNIKSIHLKEGIFEKDFKFSEYVNLIHSNKNSCGKTTMLRFILYGLGYNIPNTRKIKFGNCEIDIVLECENIGIITLSRYNEISIILTIEEQKHTYVLPEQQVDLHKLLFGTTNQNIINNLLGAYYVDQEKGWTLLNRGVVIGSIHFNIEELIRGLSGIDCEELIKKERQLSSELEKYHQMFSVAQYRDSIADDTGNLVVDKYKDEISAEESELIIRERSLKKELKRIDRTISDNRQFKKFISDMRLFVEAPDGTTFPVSENNIVGFNDSIDLLIAKRKSASANYLVVSKKLEAIMKEKNKENEQLSFLESATQLEMFDKRILNIPMNQIAIKKEISRLEKQRKEVRQRITKETKNDNKMVVSISNQMMKYMSEMGIEDEKNISQGYLFTSNLRELSGAIMHKTALAFRLAYILAIEKVLNIKLPIILDSPSGKEVDHANVKILVDLLKRDFSDHQIIIASIFTYDFETVNIIEIGNKLIQSNE